MNLYAVYLEKLDESVFNFILSRLEPERSHRIRSYKDSEDGARSLLGDVLSRTLLCEQSGIPWGSLHVKRSALGKPYTLNTDLEYSVSHAGDWIVCAIDDCTVGVDIEKIRPVDFDVVKYFFTEREATALFSRKPEQREAYFFELWTVKESCLKAKGTGLYGALNAFSVQIDQSKSDHVKQVTVTGLSEPNMQVHVSQQFHGYKLAVCSVSSFIPDKVRVLRFASLFKRFMTVL